MFPSSGGGGGGASGGLEARRLLEIAEKLLDAQDLVGGKRFAERALETDPLVDGVDQIFAIVDVLLASHRRFNTYLDCYSILQLPHPSSSTAGVAPDDTLSIKRNYRRLALLLSPDHNRFPLADSAFRLVVDSYAVLSDPAKKLRLDAELQMAASHLRSNGSATDAAVRSPDRTFWTSCPSCCHVFEYDRDYLNRILRCRTCRKPFHAGEMAAKPPVVPGTDMYYCAWGFFPLGFRGGPAFGGCIPNPGAAGVPEFGDGWKPFYPVSPWSGNQGDQPEKPLNAVPVNQKGNPVEPKVRTPARNRKAVAKKRVGNYSAKKSFPGGYGPRNGVTRPSAARGSDADAMEGVGISQFDIEFS